MHLANVARCMCEFRSKYVQLNDLSEGLLYIPSHSANCCALSAERHHSASLEKLRTAYGNPRTDITKLSKWIHSSSGCCQRDQRSVHIGRGADDG